MSGGVEATSTRYPFEPRYLDVGPGRVHYVEEGAGRPVVLVHGTPTWSFLYRRLIAGLSDEHRVIAVDHLGFGRSDKPPDADYRPEAHARNLARVLDHLGLEDVVVGVHDYGGPIGLPYAVRRPENVRGLILFNTWMWSLEGTSAARSGRLLGGRLGRALYTRLNLSPRVLLKAMFADRRKLTRELHRRYLEPFPTAGERMAPWVLARELAGSGAWYRSLWERRDRIAGKPALVLWGSKDPAFGANALARWRDLLEAARIVELPDAGHFVQEEAPERTLEEVRAFLASL